MYIGEQVNYVLQNPRQALAQSQADPCQTSDPRLSPAGNRVWRQLMMLLEQLARMDNWLSQRGRGELNAGDAGLLAPGFARLSRDAQSVAHLAKDLGEQWTGQELSHP